MEKRFPAAAIFAVLLAVSCTPSGKYVREHKVKTVQDKKFVRVLLVETADSGVKISSQGRLKLYDKKSGRLLADRATGGVVLTPEKIKNPVVAESLSGFITCNGRPYRGWLEIAPVVGRLQVINIIDIEDYLLSVVPSEVMPGWPAESLKAQAVAARTFAYYHLMNGSPNNKIYDLYSTVNSQMYKGVAAENDTTTAAVRATAGEIVSHRGMPIIAYFHSACGGKTIDGKHVWSGSTFEYLEGKQCPYCKASPNYNWEAKLALHEIKSVLAKRHKSIGSISNISFKKIDGRVTEVSIVHSNGKIAVSGNDFRLMFPAKTIKSLLFTSQKSGKSLVLRGNGFGHGVGMCQWGARGMAEGGFNYLKILNFYYNGIKIEKFIISDRRFLADK